MLKRIQIQVINPVLVVVASRVHVLEIICTTSKSRYRLDLELEKLGMGIKFEDEILGLLLLNSLPESWKTFKVFIINSAPNEVVSLQMVKDSVLNEEMRRKTQGFSSQSEVLITENRGRSQKKEREKSRSKFKSRYNNV
ncbi:hypothetical protein CR513_21349, partial [Mucuna pruriens]